MQVEETVEKAAMISGTAINRAEIRRLVPTVQMLDGDYGGDSLNPLG